MSEWIAAYLGIAVFFLAWLARVDVAVRAAFLMMLLWPATLPFLACVLAADWVSKRTGWRFDIDMRRDLSPFGIRKPQCATYLGRAVRLFWIEFQFWNPRKRESQAKEGV